MIANYLQSIHSHLQEIEDLLDKCKVGLIEEPYRVEDEIETALTIEGYTYVFDEIKKAVSLIAKKYQNRNDNLPVETKDELQKLLTTKANIVKHQDQLLEVFKFYFGNIFNMHRIDFMTRLLDSAFYPRGINKFYSQDKAAKQFIFAIIALSMKSHFKGKILLRNKRLCVSVPKYNVLIDFEKHITCRKHQIGQNETWLRNLYSYLLNFAKSGVLIPKQFEGVEFI